MTVANATTSTARHHALPSRDLRWALDPVAFAVEALDITPDPWQEDVLRLAGKRLLLNCSRQSGKSTTTAVLAAHSAIYCPGSTTLLVSPSLRQSSELFRKVTAMLDRLATPPELVEDNKLSCELANGARVVSLPSSAPTVRGFSAIDLLIEDEAAWVPDELYVAIRPMLATSDGRLILMSTPFGKRGHFFQAWENGGDAWKRIEIPASACPRISPAFLAEELRALGEWRFRQEYGCEFTDSEGSIFRYEDVRQSLSAAITPLFGGLADGLTQTATSAHVSPLF